VRSVLMKAVWSASGRWPMPYPNSSIAAALPRSAGAALGWYRRTTVG
jgi:hypothetical protein